MICINCQEAADKLCSAQQHYFGFLFCTGTLVVSLPDPLLALQSGLFHFASNSSKLCILASLSASCFDGFTMCLQFHHQFVHFHKITDFFN